MTMASLPTATTGEIVKITASLPTGLFREIDEVSAAQGRTRTELL